MWPELSKKDIAARNRHGYEEKKLRNKKTVNDLGFEPAGSPKQKSWAYDIIAEQCLPTPFWAVIQAQVSKQLQDETSMAYARFVNWLRTKPSSWWIRTFQEGDLEAIYDRFVKTLL